MSQKADSITVDGTEYAAKIVSRTASTGEYQLVYETQRTGGYPLADAKATMLINGGEYPSRSFDRADNAKYDSQPVSFNPSTWEKNYIRIASEAHGITAGDTVGIKITSPVTTKSITITEPAPSKLGDFNPWGKRPGEAETPGEGGTSSPSSSSDGSAIFSSSPLLWVAVAVIAAVIVL